MTYNLFCRWYYGYETLSTAGDYTVAFVATRGSGVYSDIALDDITLRVRVFCFMKLSCSRQTNKNAVPEVIEFAL